ncbi:MAG TPA: GWxTD domain-containing protein [Candidatus Saccharicenans sp.]|jgi:GWxTD domain-containing protein|nr:GWxTD domain-containing protein [Candidatus Saccharicenans sp.]HQI23053.1 GWxTD domain-containing protein [Candidatus Saccharicenans sp.]
MLKTESRFSATLIFIVIFCWLGSVTILLANVTAGVFSDLQNEKDIIKNLAPNYKDWLEIVTPIITETEKEVFLKLKTDRERDRFINMFWQIRDPDRDTAENEFYRDYLERVRFADQNFSVGSSRRGCLTERGYYYLLLGKPLERHIYATQSDLWPMELWFYKGEEQYSLPGYFYLIFYQPEGVGDYRLYYPGVEGPEKLVIPSLGRQTMTRSNALEVLKRINAELAKAALSYLPEDQSANFSSLSSQTIIAAIKSLPEKKFATAYARNYLSYKDLVEVDYSHNYISSSAVVKVFNQDGLNFIHWSLEPDRINFAENRGIYSAIYELTIRVEDKSGQTIMGRTEEVPLRLNRQQFEAHARQRLAFQDLFPLLPGDYKVLYLLKNKTARDFTSYETALSIPPESAAPLLSPLLLYHSFSPARDNQFKAFTFDGHEFLISARNEFSQAEKLSVYARLEKKLVQTADLAVKLTLKNMDSSSQVSFERKYGQEIINNKGEIWCEPLDLSQFKPGYYQLEVSLLEGDKVKATQKDNLIILSAAALTAPWVYARVHQPPPSTEWMKLLASQHFLKGNYAEARKLLEDILARQPDDESRLLLAKTFYALGDYRQSLSLALAVYEKTRNREAGKVIALDYASLKDWKPALIYLEELLSEGTEVSVLNLAAEAHFNLGEKEKAVALLEKSLSLIPDQPEIKARLASWQAK